MHETWFVRLGTVICKIYAKHPTNDHIRVVQEFAKVCNTTTDKSGFEQIDFAGSDSLLTAKEYSAYPDLQMFPAVFGLPHVQSHVFYAIFRKPWRHPICDLAATDELDQV